MSLLDVLESMPEPESQQEQIPASEPTPTASKANDSGSGSKTTNNDDPDARAEVIEMQNQAPLLKLIQEDTGEEGRKSGRAVYFKKCPVCGHTDCFRYYPSSNTWACFGGSNPNANANGREVGAYLAYLIRVHNMTATEAMKRLREVTNHPYEERKGKAEGNTSDNNDAYGNTTKNDGESQDDLLPPWTQCRSYNPRKETPELIHSLLRKQHVGIIAAKGKGSKTWSALRLAIEVTQGGMVAGHQCERGRVLFIDAEMGEAAIDNRVARICDALGYDKADVDSRLTIWSVEGISIDGSDGKRAPNIEDIVCSIETRGALFDLVVIDSCSNFLPKGADENSNPDVSAFYAMCRKVAQVTCASVWLVHHFGKGAQGDREAADMLRGASAWLDRPSLALVMCEIVPPNGKPSDYLAEGERAFQIECVGMRSFEWPEPIHVIWSYPVHRIDNDGITSDWAPKSSQRSASSAAKKCKEAESKAKAAQIEAEALGYFYTHAVGPEGELAPDLAKEISSIMDFEVKSKDLKDMCENSKWLEVYKKSARKHYIVPKHAIGSALEDYDEQLTIAST